MKTRLKNEPPLRPRLLRRAAAFACVGGLVAAGPATAAVTFEPPVSVPAGPGPSAVALADLDGDGHLDLAVADRWTSEVLVRPGDGAGGFGAASAFPVGPGPLAVRAADLDRDGDQDLVTADGFSDSVSVLLGDGHGEFASTVTADFDLDGARDLAVANLNSDSAGDLDGDGGPDLVVANLGEDTVTVLLDHIPDLIAPELHMPAPIEVDAVGPDGAPVSYRTTATDNRDRTPVVECSPPSGSMFAIGSSTVRCTATDRSGNAATGEFTVRVRGAAEQLGRLADRLRALALPRGIANSFAVKLDGAARPPVACGALRAFGNELRAQRAKAVPADAADAMATDAARIAAVLGCR